MNYLRYSVGLSSPRFCRGENGFPWEIVSGPASALIGGLFNSAAQKRANRTNLQIAREQNELNYRMFQEQNAFNEKMWNQTNEYNTPSKQVERLMEAGLNPAAFFSDNGAGSANIMQSASASPAAGATMLPETGFGDALASATSQFLNSVAAYKSLTEAYGQEIENANKDALFKAQIHEMQEAGNLSKEQANNVNWDSTIKQTQFNDLVATTHQQALEAQYKADIANVEAEVKKTYGLKIGEQEFNLAFQNALNAVKEGNLLEAQRELTKITGDKEKSDMIVNRMVGASQVRANNAAASKSYAEASEAQKRAYRQDLENAVYAMFGKAEAAQRFLNAMYSGEMLKKDANVAGMLNDMMKDSKFVRSTLVVGELLKAMSPFISSSAMSSAASILLK